MNVAHFMALWGLAVSGVVAFAALAYEMAGRLDPDSKRVADRLFRMGLSVAAVGTAALVIAKVAA